MCTLLVLRGSALGLALLKELFFVAAIEKSGWAVLHIGAIERIPSQGRKERVYDFYIVVIFLDLVAA